MRVPFLISLGTLLLLPASASAGVQTFGSDLAQPATVVEEHQADTAFWPTATGDGADPTVPVAGQIKEVRIKGIALKRPDRRPAGQPGGETMFHVQALDGAAFRISSQAFYMPTTGDPQQISTFRPENFCVRPGERIAFNTVGGFDGVGTQPGPGEAPDPFSPYPNGTPLQVFASVPGAETPWYQQANGTDNGESMAPHGSGPREADQGPATAGVLKNTELLMQMTVATGDDRSYECGGPNTYRPADADRAGTPKVTVQRATLPARQTVRVSRRGDAGMALFCGAGAGPCTGSVTVLTRVGTKAVPVGTAKYSIAQKSTGKLKLRLSAAGRRLFARKGRLSVSIVAVTVPGGASRTSVFSTVLRKHQAK